MVGSDGRIRLLDGRLAPRSSVLKNLKERIDASRLASLVEGKVLGCSGAETLLYALGFSALPPLSSNPSPLSRSHHPSKSTE